MLHVIDFVENFNLCVIILNIKTVFILRNISQNEICNAPLSCYTTCICVGNYFYIRWHFARSHILSGDGFTKTIKQYLPVLRHAIVMFSRRVYN